MGDCWTRWRTLPDGRRIPFPGPCQKAFTGVVVLLALAAGGAAVSGASATGAAAGSVAAQSVQTRVTNSRSAARRGQSSEAWQRMGLRVVTRATDRQIRQELDCAPQSFGQVREFFARTPCQSMHRTQSELCDEHGETIMVSITWVRMPSAVSAQQLKQLVDVDGTGNVTPIAHGSRFTGRYYAARRTGSLVVIAEAVPVGGLVSAEMLTGVAQIAAEFPSP